MTNPLTHGARYWWSEKQFQATWGAYDAYPNYFPKEEWERTGWTFEETNIQLEND
jgi:hypothetical protein